MPLVANEMRDAYRPSHLKDRLMRHSWGEGVLVSITRFVIRRRLHDLAEPSREQGCVKGTHPL